MLIKTSELRLADVITMQGREGKPFNTSIVVKITDRAVTLFRPYGHTGDFSYTGGVIPYTGIEHWDIEIESRTMWNLHTRKELK